MKRTLTLSLVIFLSLIGYSQQMRVKQPNFKTFNGTKKLSSTELINQLAPSRAKEHPEFGKVPFNAQCLNCAELIEKRTIDSRQFIDEYDAGHTYSQKSYFPLHYKKRENDIWRTIDHRLQPDANHAGVFEANDQPCPTKIDLNKHSTSIIDRGFEFEYNRNLSMYFFDEGVAYSSALPADFSHENVGEEGLEVHNIWSGINMEETFRPGEVKTNFVLNAPIQIPISKGFMVIEDRITLPQGYSIIETKVGAHDGKFYGGDYLVVDETDKTRITYERPSFVDAMAWGIKGNYQLEQNGNEYTLKLFVPVSWLTRTDNTYPLFIDPVVSGQTKKGDFVTTPGGFTESMAFTTKPASCDYHMPVIVPGKSQLTNAYVDLEYRLQFDPACGVTPQAYPFCTFSQVTQEIICDACGTTSGNLVCNPQFAPFTGTCTTDSNLVPGANAIRINSFVPNYLACYAPQCPDYVINFTLKNRDSTCQDVCGWLCAMGYMWQMTVEACQINANITPVQTTICAGQPVVLTAHPSCGVAPYHFVWTSDGGNTFDTIYGSSTYTVAPNQTVFVSCTAFDTCGLSAVTNDAEIDVTPAPPANAGGDAHLCAGGPIQIGGSPTSTPGTTIQWTGETGTVQSWLNSTSIQNPTANIPAGTIDTFFYVVRASTASCFRRDTVFIFSSPIPTANAGADIILCEGGTVLIGGSPSSNAATILWSSETGTMESWLNITSAANPQAVIPAGTVDTFFYALTATTASCVAKDTMYIFSKPIPLADAGADVRLCEGGLVNLGGSPTATNGASILWSGENALAQSWLSSTSAANPQATVPAGTVDTFFYAVHVFDPDCFSDDTMMVFSAANPTAQIDTSGFTVICSNQSVTITTTQNFSTYDWNNGSTASSIQVNQSGQYFVVVTDANGCKDTSNIVTINSVAAPTVQVYPDTLIIYGDSVMLYTDINLSSASIDSFRWYPAINISCTQCNNPLVSPIVPAQYYGVTLYAGGCTATDSALIRVIFPNNFYIPNAFTPNGDGNNDEFYIQAQSGVRVILFQVFNRWGEKVHEGSYPWDGNYKGKPAPAGVYIYIFKLGLFGDDTGIFRKGSVTLIR